MEPSSDRTRISRRSKGACSIALVVGFGCAVFGVGGAAAGDGSYGRHLREARLEAKLAGAALAHRTPEQLLLAVTPRPHTATAPAPATPTVTTPAPTVTTPAPTVTAPATTSTTPAATVTTPAAPAPTLTPSNTTATPAGPTQNDGGTANVPTGSGNTLTDTTADNGNTDNGNTGTTATGTTTTGTTTTGTTTTGTTTTPGNADGVSGNGNPYNGYPYGNGFGNGNGYGYGNGYGHGNGNGNGNGSGNGNGNADANGSGSPSAVTGSGSGAFGNGSSTSQCHGRCSGFGQSGTSGVVPSATPSTSSSSTGTGFTLGVSPITSTPATATSTPSVTATTPVNDASTGLLNPTASSTPSGTTLGSSNANGLSVGDLTGSLTSTTSALRKVTKGAAQPHSTLLASAGTGGATAGALAGGATAATAGGGALTGAGTTHGTAGAATTKGSHHGDKRHASGGAGLLANLTATPASVVNHFIKVIPTAIWIALAAAFALALAFAALALRSGRRARKREKEFVAISAAAQTDALTGILNRRGFMDASERELARASRYNRPFVLAYVDVRGLKAVNDTEGHLMGDELIKTVAGLMKESARADDVVGRIGGDEFALLLGEQTVESAEPVIRRIRARVAERRAAMEIRMPWELTIGIAAFPQDGSTLEELLGVADRRLYEQRGIALR
jgi:diguanylate cyclase (GGDEF)-like protein